MKKYNKILIVGPIGSGKTTLANKISKMRKIKCYELDDIAYKKRETFDKHKPKVRDKKIKSILKKKNWIIEGFYSRPWIYPLYRKADIVLILKIKPSISKKRIITRFLKRKFLSKRKTNLKRTMSLFTYINEYPNKYFKIQKEIAKENNKNVLVLNTTKEINKFIKSMK